MSERVEYTVMLHGFVDLDSGDVEHMDSDDPECAGFNVWLRRDYPDRGPDAFFTFDAAPHIDMDFVTIGEARTYANAVANAFDAPLDEY